MRTLTYTAIALIATASACSKKKKHSETPEGENKEGTTYSSTASGQLFLAHSFSANTPKGLKNGSALSLSAESDVCNQQYTPDTPEANGCLAMAEIKDRFFTSGPTVIKSRLQELDERLNGTIAGLSSQYVPCLDSSRTEEGDFTVMSVGGDKSVHFPAFTLFDIPLSSTFNEGKSFTTGKTVHLSCLQSDGSGTSSMKIGYGLRDGKWSLLLVQGNGMSMAGTADKDDSIDMWFSLGDPTRDAAQAGIETEGADLRNIYPMSTAIAQVVSKPKLGIMGISLLGAGVGPGCGSRLIMNSSTLYFRGNINNYGSCFANDFSANPPGGLPAFSAQRADVEVCMNVNGDSLTPSTDGLETCVKSGLLSRDANEAIVSPFEDAGLKHLTTNPDDADPDAILGKAWMGGFFLQDADLSAIPPMSSVKMNPTDKVEITGYHHNAWDMNRTTDANADRASVSAKCNADAGARTATLSESFSLSIGEILANTRMDANAKVNGKTLSAAEQKAALIAAYNTALTETGATAPSVSVSVSGSRGATYKGSFTGTVSVKLDGAELGTGTLALPAASGIMQDTAAVALSAATVTENSTFTVTVDGTLTLECDNALDVNRSVGVKAGLAQLVWNLRGQ